MGAGGRTVEIAGHDNNNNNNTCSSILCPLTVGVASARPPSPSRTLRIWVRNALIGRGCICGEGERQSSRSLPVAPLVQSECVNPVQMSSLRVAGAPVSEPLLSFTLSRLIVPSRPARINIHIRPINIVFKPTHQDVGAKTKSCSVCRVCVGFFCALFVSPFFCFHCLIANIMVIDGALSSLLCSHSTRDTFIVAKWSHGALLGAQTAEWIDCKLLSSKTNTKPTELTLIVVTCVSPPEGSDLELYSFYVFDKTINHSLTRDGCTTMYHDIIYR